MEQLFFDEAQEVRNELSKTIQNMVPLEGPDWQGWNKARRVKIRTDIESLLIMYDQAIFELQKLSIAKGEIENQFRIDNDLTFYNE